MKQEKIAFVTGATGGIGKATALTLAQLGYTVVVHGRNEEKAAAVCREITSITGNKKVNYIIGDLFLMSEVKRVAETFISKYGKLDILINNAGGLMSKERKVTAEGVETTIAVNLLAPFLLTRLLLDLLAQSEDGRVINVASNAHSINAKPDLKDIELVSNYNPLVAYGNSKLFLIWITQRFAEKLAAEGVSNVKINAVHPGAVATNFAVDSNLGGLLNLFVKLARPFFKTPMQGAVGIIQLAISKAYANVTGKYFEKNKPVKPSEKYYSRKNEELIWEYCEEKVKKWS